MSKTGYTEKLYKNWIRTTRHNQKLLPLLLLIEIITQTQKKTVFVFSREAATNSNKLNVNVYFTCPLGTNAKPLRISVSIKRKLKLFSGAFQDSTDTL